MSDCVKDISVSLREVLGRPLHLSILPFSPATSFYFTRRWDDSLNNSLLLKAVGELPQPADLREHNKPILLMSVKLFFLLSKAVANVFVSDFLITDFPVCNFLLYF